MRRCERENHMITTGRARWSSRSVRAIWPRRKPQSMSSWSRQQKELLRFTAGSVDDGKSRNAHLLYDSKGLRRAGIR